MPARWLQGIPFRVPMDAIYFTGMPLLAPRLLAGRRVFRETAGRFLAHLSSGGPWRARGDAPVLIHAVSVGEVQIGVRLAAALEALGLPCALATATRRGAQAARKAGVEPLAAPLDFAVSVNGVLGALRPRALALVELELWPNLISVAARGGPVIVVNGRVSARTFPRYLRLKSVLRGVVRRVSLVLAQNAAYAHRFRELGFARVETAGNIKYDAAPPVASPRERLDIRLSLRCPERVTLLIGGSTYREEEEALLDAFVALRKRESDARLILAPRQSDHFDALDEAIRRRGLRRRRMSAEATVGWDVLVVDTVGDLARLYGAADIAFVGGSLFAGKGGHSVIEPAARGVGVLVGPHHANFADAVLMLSAAGGLRVVRDAAALRDAVLDGVRDRSALERMGGEGARAVDLHRGAAGRQARAIATLLRKASARTRSGWRPPRRPPRP